MFEVVGGTIILVDSRLCRLDLSIVRRSLY